MSSRRLWNTADVAGHFGVHENTIRDKYTRQLGISAREFDELVWNWIEYGDGHLRTLLENTCGTRAIDATPVSRFFNSHLGGPVQINLTLEGRLRGESTDWLIQELRRALAGHEAFATLGLTVSEGKHGFTV